MAEQLSNSNLETAVLIGGPLDGSECAVHKSQDIIEYPKKTQPEMRKLVETQLEPIQIKLGLYKRWSKIGPKRYYFIHESIKL